MVIRAARPIEAQCFVEALIHRAMWAATFPKVRFEDFQGHLLDVWLPDILRNRLGVRRVVPIAHQFPIKRPGSQLSRNVDRLYFARDAAKSRQSWLFVELKGEPGLVNQKQLENYRRARECGMRSLVEDIESIRRHSRKAQKYERILQNATPYPLDCPIQIVYLGPPGMEVGDKSILKISFDDLDTFAVGRFRHIWNLARRSVLSS
jgi:hypothetical protein